MVWLACQNRLIGARGFAVPERSPLPRPFGRRTIQTLNIVCKLLRINTCKASCKCWALLTSSLSKPMPQAVNVVGQAEQQGLADLGGQAASGCARGEFAFDGREDAFDLGTLPIRFFRKGSEHLIPNGAIRDTPAPRGNDALRS